MHRGSLDESMQTAVCIDDSIDEVRAYLFDHGMESNDSDRIQILPYGYDDRIDWHNHIVTVNGDAVAFTDGPLE